MTSATSDDPALTKERRIASARRRICHCCSVLPNGGRGAEDISGPGGPRKFLKRLETDKEIQGKPSRFLGLSLPGLGPIWLNLDSAWIGLGPISTCTIWKASTPIAAASRPARCVELLDPLAEVGSRHQKDSETVRCTRAPAAPISIQPTPIQSGGRRQEGVTRERA
jgi:hypothetical protein